MVGNADGRDAHCVIALSFKYALSRLAKCRTFTMPSHGKPFCDALPLFSKPWPLRRMLREAVTDSRATANQES